MVALIISCVVLLVYCVLAENTIRKLKKSLAETRSNIKECEVHDNYV